MRSRVYSWNPVLGPVLTNLRRRSPMRRRGGHTSHAHRNPRGTDRGPKERRKRAEKTNIQFLGITRNGRSHTHKHVRDSRGGVQEEHEHHGSLVPHFGLSGSKVGLVNESFHLQHHEKGKSAYHNGVGLFNIDNISRSETSGIGVDEIRHIPQGELRGQQCVLSQIIPSYHMEKRRSYRFTLKRALKPSPFVSEEVISVIEVEGRMALSS